MELGEFYQFFQVQEYGRGAWKSLRTKESARRAFLLWIFRAGGLFPLSGRRVEKLPMVMYGYLSDRQCGTMTRQLPGNEQDEFY